MRELKRIRKERGWSQQRLADESTVNKATINQVEQGKRSPTIETLEKLANALDVEVADFFPKAQSPLPLREFVEAGQGADSARTESGALYTSYEALGRVLALSWKDELKEWDEKIPSEATPDLFDFGRLLEWAVSISAVRSMYAAIARDSRHPLPKELEDTLGLVDLTSRAARRKLMEVIESTKTNAEFRKIVEASELEMILSNAEQDV